MAKNDIKFNIQNLPLNRHSTVIDWAMSAKWKSIRALFKKYKVITGTGCSELCSNDNIAINIEIWQMTGELKG